MGRGVSWGWGVVSLGRICRVPHSDATNMQRGAAAEVHTGLKVLRQSAVGEPAWQLRQEERDVGFP